MKNLLLTILLLPFTSLIAQNSIYGKVTDASNQEAIPFASVLLFYPSDSQYTVSDFDGYFIFDSIPNGNYSISVNYIGYKSSEPRAFQVRDKAIEINMALQISEQMMEEVSIVQYKTSLIQNYSSVSIMSVSRVKKSKSKKNYTYSPTFTPDMAYTTPKESKQIEGFTKTSKENTSTFSIDVDKASYSLVRKSILENRTIPSAENVRIEEMINYFNYAYAAPKDDAPFSVNTEVSACSWNEKAQILQIGLQGKQIDYENLEASNLVFLIDVSGSMSGQLSLIKASLKKLIAVLDGKDKISIVSYAGNAGLVLSSTAVSEQNKIISAIDNLEAGGSTAGGAGIQLAYKIAKNNFIEDGNNRVILCTDGDFNVGISSSEKLEDLIVKKKKSNIFLTVCGFGGYNYQDSRMEQLADKGNGNYYFIDKIEEAEKVFVNEMRATLFLIAKDVKIQIEFNKDLVESYRLIGYSNRKLDNEDFKDDKKDAGELGAGHQVTALYEIILKEDKSAPKIADLNLRYKTPEGEKSILITTEIDHKILTEKEVSPNHKLANIVSSFGVLLSEVNTQNKVDLDDLISKAIALNKEANMTELKELIEIMKAYKKISI